MEGLQRCEVGPKGTLWSVAGWQETVVQVPGRRSGEDFDRVQTEADRAAVFLARLHRLEQAQLVRADAGL